MANNTITHADDVQKAAVTISADMKTSGIEGDDDQRLANAIAIHRPKRQ